MREGAGEERGSCGRRRDSGRVDKLWVGVGLKRRNTELVRQQMMGDSYEDGFDSYNEDGSYEDGLEQCGFCGWCPEYPDCHVQHSPGCPEVRAKFEVSVEDGELCWRKRDFLWLAVKLAAWRKRAIARVEASYAPDGPRGKEIIDEWATL